MTECVVTYAPPAVSIQGGGLRGEFRAARKAMEGRGGALGLFQLCIFRLGFLQNGDIGVGIFPKGKEILVGRTALRLITGERPGAAQVEVDERLPGVVCAVSLGLNHFLELCHRFASRSFFQAGLATKERNSPHSALVGNGPAERLDGLGGIAAMELEPRVQKGQGGVKGLR